MKYLNELIDDSNDTARLERKFIVTKGQCALGELRLKAAGFKKLYDSRMISSIYFDDANHSFLRANVDGSPVRDKVRLRTYNEDYSTSVVETKHKRGAVGFKTISELDCRIKDQAHLIAAGKAWCRRHLLNVVMPSSRIDYVRSYYSRGDFRATVDFNIRSSRIAGSTKINAAMYDYSVIEFKYGMELDQDFRSIYPLFSAIAIRNTKSSKYANSLMY